MNPKNNEFLINSIYLSTEGEGIHLGHPQIFVRFQGCPIGCANCDSKETWDFNAFPPQSLKDVLNRIEQINRDTEIPIKRVSITGGDPLHPRHQDQVLQLAQALKDQGFYLNIEASGTRIVREIFDVVDFISFDFKTPSTRVRTPLSLIPHLAKEYRGKFQIKAVVADTKDFEETWRAYQEVKKNHPAMDFPWCLTPALTPGEPWTLEHFVMMMRRNEKLGGPFRVIGQQHKWVYGPEAKEV